MFICIGSRHGLVVSLSEAGSYMVLFFTFIHIIVLFQLYCMVW
jgi:hypothetical protein